jgi:hypothetical protein
LDIQQSLQKLTEAVSGSKVKAPRLAACHPSGGPLILLLRVLIPAPTMISKPSFKNGARTKSVDHHLNTIEPEPTFVDRQHTPGGTTALHQAGREQPWADVIYGGR